MVHKLVFTPQIPDDLSLALEPYESISLELANRFRTCVELRFDDIAERPESFPFDVPPIRFARIEKFPYIIFFVAKRQFVSIISVLHGTSGPNRALFKTTLLVGRRIKPVAPIDRPMTLSFFLEVQDAIFWLDGICP